MFLSSKYFPYFIRQDELSDKKENKEKKINENK